MKILGLTLSLLIFCVGPQARANVCVDLLNKFFAQKAYVGLDSQSRRHKAGVAPDQVIGGVAPALSQENMTPYLISYLDRLVANDHIEMNDLSYFLAHLNSGVITTAVKRNERHNESSLQQVKEHFYELLRSGYMDREKLVAWAKAARMKKNWKFDINQKALTGTDKITFTPSSYLKNNGIEVFHLPRMVHGKLIQLSHPIEIMSQGGEPEAWYELMGIVLPPYYANISEHLFELNGKQVLVGDGHRISTSWWNALVFANRLSVIHGFKPAYDLSAIEFEGGPEGLNGEFVPVGDVSEALRKIKINAPGGDVYRAEGYRLPTYAEHNILDYKFRESSIIENAAWAWDHGWEELGFEGNSDLKEEATNLAYKFGRNPIGKNLDWPARNVIGRGQYAGTYHPIDGRDKSRGYGVQLVRTLK